MQEAEPRQIFKDFGGLETRCILNRQEENLCKYIRGKT
jgi:hypothetical protein